MTELAAKLDNSALLRADLAERRSVWRGLPEVVSLQTTEVCNFRCIMCPRREVPGVLRLDRSHLLRVGAELFPTAWKTIVTGAAGEPVDADFPALLELCARHRVRMDLFTNGSRLDRETYRAGRDVFDQLNVSLDAATAPTFERIRRGGSFDRTLAMLDALREERARRPDEVILTFSAVVMKSNLAELADLVRLARRFGADGVVLQRLRHEVAPTLAEDPLLDPGYERAAPFVEEAARTARELGIDLYAAEIGLPDQVARAKRPKVPEWIGSRFGTCWALAQNFGVMPTGDVYPCCVPTDHRFGNVMFDDCRTIWNSPAAVGLRQAQFSGRGTLFCRGCIYAPEFKGRAPGPVGRLARRVRLKIAAYRNARRLARSSISP